MVRSILSLIPVRCSKHASYRTARLQQAIAKPLSQNMTPPEQRALSILLFIASLLCEHCAFDRLRLEHDSVSLL